MIVLNRLGLAEDRTSIPERLQTSDRLRNAHLGCSFFSKRCAVDLQGGN